MIINLSSSGNMCNRLLQFAHCISIGINNDQDVVHLFMGDLAEEFDFNDANDIQIKVLKKGIFNNKYWFKMRKKIEALYVRYDYKSYEIRCINNNEQFLKKIPRNKITFINNWYVRDYKSLIQYRDQIREIIKPRSHYQTKASEEIKQLKETFTTIVGVHLRRGDYKLWQNGAFYYTDKQYNFLIKGLNDEMKKNGENPIFLLFSNEQIDSNKFHSDINIRICKGGPVEDFTLLSMCDYMLGPPSTFSWLAHYLGNSKYKVIFDPEIGISLDDFDNGVPEEINSYNLEELWSSK